MVISPWEILVFRVTITIVPDLGGGLADQEVVSKPLMMIQIFLVQIKVIVVGLQEIARIMF